MTLSPHLNVFVGDNASGKSSLIEAISLLSCGRSFRTHHIQDLIAHHASHILVAGKLSLDQDKTCPIGIYKTCKEQRIRINHDDAKQVDLTRYMPVAIIHPDTLNMITGAPTLRRSLVDWVAFYRHAEFHTKWKQYQRVLQQRNACLRDESQHYALGYWNEQWAVLQANLARIRQSAVQYLTVALNQYQTITQTLGMIQLRLQHGFPQSVEMEDTKALLAFLHTRQAQEIAQGFSLYGAHRADLHIMLEGQLANRVASRGQLKLLGIALLLAKSYAIADQSKARGIIAVDDLTSELDDTNQANLYYLLQQTQQQVMITGTRLPPIEKITQQAQVFHVKQGQCNTWN